MKKIAYLVLAVVLLLGSMGLAYAKWSDTVHMTANVATDSVQWCFSSVGTVSDPCNGTFDKTIPFAGTNCQTNLSSITPIAQPKDVACFAVNPVDCHNMSLVVTNAYPFYYGAFDFVACNQGSVPVNVCSVQITDGTNTWVICAGRTLALDLNGDGACDMLLWWGDSFGNQIDPVSWGANYQTCADISVHFAFLENLQQKHSSTNIPANNFTLGMTMNVTQWNEACSCTASGPTITATVPPTG